MSGERRTQARKPTRLEVRLPRARMLKVLWAANLSHGGAAIETPDVQPVGATLQLHLVLPEGEFELQGVVRHVARRKDGRGYVLGVRFDPVAAEHRSVIERILSHQKER